MRTTGEDMENGELPCSVGVTETNVSTVKIIGEVSQKTKNRTTI